MRKFIVSDLHGNGEVYDSMMAYLENIALLDDVELYINGDLIDRGLDSYRMLCDVRDRILGKGNIKIHYLGGNHELMMYQALCAKKPGKAINPWCDWMSNGGHIIEGVLDSSKDGEEKCEEFKEFLGTLKIYHLFDEKILNKPIVLVHARAPQKILKECPMTIADNNWNVFNAVWKRKSDGEEFFFFRVVPSFNRIGLDGYFTIIGHTPVNNRDGFYFDKRENVLNIDGGCAAYACEYFDYDHVPLVEVVGDALKILVFNHNNEIIQGYYYDGTFYRLKEESVDKDRLLLDSKFDNIKEEKVKLIKRHWNILKHGCEE